MAPFDFHFTNALAKLRDEHRYRTFRAMRMQQGRFPRANWEVQDGEREVTVWCSNDYLGLSHAAPLIEVMSDAIKAFGTGAGGTRNIAGTHPAHVALEGQLAEWHDKEAALLFSSGWVANLSALGTLGRILPNCVFLSDAANHNSMIEGMRRSKAEIRIFRHNDLNHLEELLAACPAGASPVIAFEGVYSMDGSTAQVREICDLAERYGAFTYLDEVHSAGLYGPQGAGIAALEGVAPRVSMIQGTMAKAFGLMGGYITGSAAAVDAVRSHAESFIFSTSLPAYIAATASASLGIIKDADGLRADLAKRVGELRADLADIGIPVIPGETQIVPVMIGDAHLTNLTSSLLLNVYGIYAQPINYPTVPKGSERLRLTPTPHHDSEMIDSLVSALEALSTEMGWRERPLRGASGNHIRHERMKA